MKYENSAINKVEEISGEARREQKAEELRDNKNRKKNNDRRVKSAYRATVVTLSALVLLLGSVIAFKSFTTLDSKNQTATQQQSFYELVGYVDSMDVNLSKLVVTTDNEKRQKLLGDVRVESNLATKSLSELPLRDEEKYYTVKFINQVGDYSKYLSEKMIDGEVLTGEDVEILSNMQKINAELKNNLSALASELGEDYDFRALFDGNENDVIISKFKELEKGAMEYPHMIYDGAFSDGTDGKEAKALKGEKELSKSEAAEAFMSAFSNYDLKDVVLVGESTGKVIETYNFEAKDKEGVMLSAQLSKKGGKIVEFNYFKDCDDDRLDMASAEEVAKKFLEKVGYKALKAVWSTSGGNTATFNFASAKDGVICYLDLVKVNVCRERGMVSGLEASSYIYNHHERTLERAEITLAEAKEKVGTEIAVESSRLAIIPKGEFAERLAYEFVGTYEGSTYYVYIDAKTGRELDVFKVVESTEGTLLM